MGSGKISFEKDRNGFETVEVENEYGSARIAIQGAQVLSWMPEGEKPVVWLSDHAKFVKGKSARGGIPICWPWFGPHASESSYPAHGFARNLDWELRETKHLAEGTSLLFRLIPHEVSWPHDSELECAIRIGKAFEMDLVTRNRGGESFTIGCALHTYFAVSDVRKVEVSGLEGTAYLDKVHGGKKLQEGAVKVESEVDRIYIDTASACRILDPEWGRTIVVEKMGSRSTVVWNPWIDKADKMGDLGEEGYLRMLCVESCNAADDLITVPPGGEHVLKVRYSLEKR